MNESEQGSSEAVQDHPFGYCGDKRCWCHFDVGYHEQVTEMPATASSEDYQQALSFFGVVHAK